jgi:hypothetical protein
MAERAFNPNLSLARNQFARALGTAPGQNSRAAMRVKGVAFA